MTIKDYRGAYAARVAAAGTSVTYAQAEVPALAAASDDIIMMFFQSVDRRGAESEFVQRRHVDSNRFLGNGGRRQNDIFASSSLQ